MPSGRTHDRITLWTLPLVGGLTLAITHSPLVTLGVCAGYLFGGLMLGPDLDTHSIHYKRWGWLRWIWLPYRGRVRHRSPLSHAPITGTTVRVVYLLVWLAVAWAVGTAIVSRLWQLEWSWSDAGRWFWRSIVDHRIVALALFAGLELGAFSHYTADWAVSSFKRKKRRRSAKRR